MDTLKLVDVLQLTLDILDAHQMFMILLAKDVTGNPDVKSQHQMRKLQQQKHAWLDWRCTLTLRMCAYQVSFTS